MRDTHMATIPIDVWMHLTNTLNLSVSKINSIKKIINLTKSSSKMMLLKIIFYAFSMSHYTKVTQEPADNGNALLRYRKIRKAFRVKLYLLVVIMIITALAVLFLGAYTVGPIEIIKVLFGSGSGTSSIVILFLRLPRIVAAIVAGLGLSLAGTVMQGVLRNPLGSPFTLGISNGAAFGAAFAIVALGAGSATSPAIHTSATPLYSIHSIYLVSTSAFIGALGTMAIVLMLSGFRNMRSDAVILAGIALASLFTSGTVLLQYLATDVELAAIVFWSFGDVSRSSWNEIGITSFVVLAGAIYLLIARWRINALSESDEIAASLGINPGKTRLFMMIVASVITACVVAFHGVIAFLGLLAPHMGRRIVGDDMRLLLPLSGIIGCLLLLVSDTVGRVIVSSGTLPVGVITSFMGAPMFIILLLRRRR